MLVPEVNGPGFYGDYRQKAYEKDRKWKRKSILTVGKIWLVDFLVTTMPILTVDFLELLVYGRTILETTDGKVNSSVR